MKLIRKITLGDDTFCILKMEDLDRTAISEHLGKINGEYIMYSGLMQINDKTLANPAIGFLWANIKLEDTYETVRECKLAIKARCYQKAYAQSAYVTSLMMDNINRVKKIESTLEELSRKVGE